jgi:hypothetical protein
MRPPGSLGQGGEEPSHGASTMAWMTSITGPAMLGRGRLDTDFSRKSCPPDLSHFYTRLQFYDGGAWHDLDEDPRPGEPLP